MSSPSSGPRPDEELDETHGAEGSRFALVAQFFLIPLAVVIVAVTIFLVFGLLAREKHAPEEYLDEIVKGSMSRRKLAAFELATQLGTRPELAANDTLYNKTLAVFASSREPEVRRYLALALGHFDRPESVTALVTALGDEDLETRLNTIVALASLADPRAVSPLLPILRDDEPSLRKAAAFALGHIGDRGAIAALEVTAEDSSFEVALQGALALAQLGSGRGQSVLLEAIDRTKLHARLTMQPAQEDENIVNAIRGLVLLGDAAALPALRTLATSDPSPKVQDTARRAIDRLEAPPEVP